MSSINKIGIYECDTCKRTIEQLTDGRRPDPVYCVITNRCRGKLTLKNTRMGTQPKLVAPVLGLADWVKRGTVAEVQPETIVQAQASISSFGGLGGLVIAAMRERTAGYARTFFVRDIVGDERDVETVFTIEPLPKSTVINAYLYELTPAVLEYKQYTYNFSTSALTVEGQDDSPAQRMLRFSTSNTVKVLVNGVQLGVDEFDRTTDNRITLTPQINDANIVIDVFVYNDLSVGIDEANLIQIQFEALASNTVENTAIRNSTAWGDVKAIIDTQGTNLLYYCSDITVLDTTKSYAVAYFEAATAMGASYRLDPAHVVVLLSSPPYAFNDKQLNRHLQGDKLINNVLKFIQNETTGVFDLSVAEELIAKSFEPIQVGEKLNIAELTNPLASATTEQSNIPLPIAFILGPS
jgi:hypothetical protein